MNSCGSIRDATFEVELRGKINVKVWLAQVTTGKCRLIGY